MVLLAVFTALSTSCKSIRLTISNDGMSLSLWISATFWVQLFAVLFFGFRHGPFGRQPFALRPAIQHVIQDITARDNPDEVFFLHHWQSADAMFAQQSHR